MEPLLMILCHSGLKTQRLTIKINCGRAFDTDQPGDRGMTGDIHCR